MHRATVPTPLDTSRNPVRERIVAAALQLIQENGIHLLTQARVSALAGVRQSHLTYYFPTRGEMLQQVVIAGTAAILDTLHGADGSHLKSIAQFRTLMLRQLQDKRLARLICAVTAASEESPELKPWLHEQHRNGIERMRLALAAIGLVPPPLELELFRAALSGLLQTSLSSSTAASERRLRELAGYAFERLVQSCATPVAIPHLRRQASA